MKSHSDIKTAREIVRYVIVNCLSLSNGDRDRLVTILSTIDWVLENNPPGLFINTEDPAKPNGK